MRTVHNVHQFVRAWCGQGGGDVSGPTRLRASAGVEGRGRVRGSQGTHREDQHDGKPEADLHDGNGRGRRRCTSGAASAHRGASAAAADPVAHTGKRARARRDAHSTVPVRQRAQQQQGARSGAGHCGGTRGSMAALGEGEAQDRRSTAAGSAPPPRTPPPRAQEEGAARSPASAPAHSASAKHAASTARSPPSMPDMCVAFSFSPLLFREHVLFRPPVPSTGNLRIQDRTSVTHFVLFCPTLGTRRWKRGFANSNNEACPCDE